MDIRKYLENNRLITDGSMGTYYESLTGDQAGMAEKANLCNPEIIRQIHRRYIEAGAQLIRTNTFAVNSMFIADQEQIRQSITAGWDIAAEAIQACGREDLWAAADLGPIYEDENRDSLRIEEEYRMLIDLFLQRGADIFVFETLSELRYAKKAAEYIKQKKPGAFVIVQFSIDRYGMTKGGFSARSLLDMTGQEDAIDAVGFNCGVGPLHLFEIMSKLKFPEGKYVTALPNAGYPVQLRGHIQYSENISYYVELVGKIADLGLDVVGGCCGTTPKHIAGIKQLLEGGKRPPKKIVPVNHNNRSNYFPERKTAFVQKLENGEMVYAVELDPPFDSDDRKLFEGAEKLNHSGIDLITIADSPLARTRADSVACAVKVKYRLDMPVMPHISCRDKNTIALRAQFLGMHMNDIRNTLIVTGDPVARGDRDLIRSVYNFNSIRLMEYLQTMNEEVFSDSPVYYGGALNQNAGRLEAIAARMQQKIVAGASWFMTQPVYSQEEIDRLGQLRETTGGRILAGIMPLVSRKNALFIKNEMPGIKVPDEIVALYEEGLSREDYEEIAVSISIDLMQKLKGKCDGYYMMTPFNRVSLIERIVEKAKEVL